MTTVRNPPPRTSVALLLNNAKINSTKNDYEYRSGWNPNVVMGQQYRLSGAETKKLIAAIAKHPKSQRAQLLNELHQRSEQTASKGTVALDPASAKLLNAFAKKEKLDLSFDSGQPRPMHPIG